MSLSNLKKNILLVEDDRAVCDLVSQILEAHGFHTICAPDGEVALKILESFIPDLVILDLHLPKVDGHQFLARLPKLTERLKRELPVVLMSGHVGELRRELSQPIVGVLPKPVCTEDLVETVEMAMQP